ncbi:MAG: HAD family phosphatase [Clostridia bacterium]|nr:HAD family phosphatase [Clostridia bacterium]
MIKMVVADYDDTTAHGETVTERVKEAIKMFREKGGKYVICTGRDTLSIDSIIEKNGLTVDAVASYVGGFIRAEGKVLSSKGLPSETVVKIIAAIKEKFGMPSLAFFADDDTMYYNGTNEYVRNYIDWTKCKVKKAEELSDERGKCNKILVPRNNVEEDIMKVKEFVDEKFGDDVLSFSMWHVLEIVSKNATKYDAVKSLAEHFGIKEDEVVTMGDSANDLPLIKFGTGIMIKGGGGETFLKDVAKYKAPPIAELPVAAVLESIVDGTFPKGFERI